MLEILGEGCVVGHTFWIDLVVVSMILLVEKVEIQAENEHLNVGDK